jgi:translation elongation factor P/translation initiation factor 5A
MSSENSSEEFLTPVQAHALKKGNFVLIKGHPCKVQEVKLSKTGKHGHMKARVSARCIVTGIKYESVKPGHTIMQQISVEKDEFQLAYVDEDEKETLRFIDEAGNEADFKVIENAEVKALRDAKKEDAEDESDFTATIVKTPMAKGDENSAVNVVHVIVTWRSDKH